ncbi:uncharacterized protein EHS24_003949 [Apiotrichum porosum]|uniref:Uncharacterized protein n=1 Tax=Apiotrichum porosum TaxID=105984 RepID=A0A427XDV3_9TREE|nr:uncharacterized protein EHS24_003949 [Apiotrichum porosum]RSH77008.1 hypothetical protein EHS24_003949 [Apiotrichum porosum]
MDLLNNLAGQVGGNQNNNQQQQQQGGQQQGQSGGFNLGSTLQGLTGGGNMEDKLNSMGGGGAQGEADEDFLDKAQRGDAKTSTVPCAPYALHLAAVIGSRDDITHSSQLTLPAGVDLVQQYGMGGGQQSNETAAEQAKDEVISDMIRGKYKEATGSDFFVADKEKHFGNVGNSQQQ